MHRPHRAVIHRLGRLQGRLNLRRVVAVVVGDSDALVFAHNLKPASRALKDAGRSDGLLHPAANLNGRGDGRDAVEDVVVAGNVQQHCPQIFAPAVQVIAGVPAVGVDDVFGVIVVVLPHAEGQHLLARYSLNRFAGVGVLAVIDDRLGCHLCKLMVGGDDVVHRLKIFHVVGVDVEDDRDVRVQLEEVVLKLTRLTGHDVAAAQPAAAADGR